MAWLEWVANFLFYYPLLMSVIWMVGSGYFYFRYERKSPEYPVLKDFPLVSILIPAHNERDQLSETIGAVLQTEYPNYEILIINDGSTDGTGAVAERMAQTYSQIRSLDLLENHGKAAALNFGTLLAKGEILVTIDADCLLDKKALHWMVWHFQQYPRVGAVTGNPRVRNRTTLLAKIQTGEYASIIGMIKRTQRLLGKVLTVSGVIAAFRKKAVLECDLWDTDMVTEDINMTWKLEKKFWAVHYELNAIGWILVPESFKGFWKQRVRWAQGGIEVLRRHKDIWVSWKCRRLWPVYLDYVFGVVWGLAFVTMAVIWFINLFFPGYIAPEYGISPIPYWNGSVIALVCLIQFLVALSLDSKYDSSLYQHFVWVIWYPVIYWMFNAVAVCAAIPRALTKKLGEKAVWKSPDRGLQVVHAADVTDIMPKVTDSVIIDDAQLVKMDQKVMETSVMGIGLGILSFFLVILTLAIWFFAGRYFYNHLLVPAYLGDFDATFELIFQLAVFAVIVFIILLLWAQYNIRVFGKLDRRKYPQPVTAKEIGDKFNLSEDQVPFLQAIRCATLHMEGKIPVIYERMETSAVSTPTADGVCHDGCRMDLI